MTDLQTIELDRDMRICSFHTENMYNNIPESDTMNVSKIILESNPEINMNVRKYIINILQTVIEQNYFQSDQQYSKQTDGLAMGAPTSTVLGEIYIQHMKHRRIANP
jgi:hypothetical protein